ncbi:hypothetical protein ACGF1Z_23705 [Streptomyces sp. NPDC048018]|uniref:hypothetical protein n=1 Tax=Streptomyces sp. NPDC048018 TaxID=3365499 RepID=UPI003719DC17
MADTAPHTTRDPRAEHPCPACGQLRHVLAKRHKVLGTWVPEWEVQPCRNPRCELYEAERPEDASASAPGSAGDASGGDGAEAAPPHVTGKNGETGRSPAPG